jgi:hypothetical protein
MGQLRSGAVQGKSLQTQLSRQPWLQLRHSEGCISADSEDISGAMGAAGCVAAVGATASRSTCWAVGSVHGVCMMCRWQTVARMLTGFLGPASVFLLKTT